MRCHILAVGKFRPGPLRDLYEEYARRLSPRPTLVEVEEKRPLPAVQRTERESELLLAQIPPGAFIVALDEAGSTLSSPDLAARFSLWRDQGVDDVAFLIGGADGHSPELRARAGLLLSLGRATWPHLLVRALIAEQIYRAQQILAGHPYHRGEIAKEGKSA